MDAAVEAEPEAQVAELAAAVRASERVLVFTGAGMSTASGIPDFRGPGGLWTRRQPVLFQDFVASEEARRAHWQYKAEGHREFAQALPNAAHRALVALERLGKLDTLVTQNVDGLHQDAGHDPERIVELHGTNRLVECLSCGVRSAPEAALEEFRATGDCPRCRACGGILKAATVSFGQPMPQAELQRAFRAARRADLALAIGSTLEVRPAADVPLAAVGSGARYAIINRGPTGHDRFADLRLEGDVTVILPALIHAVGIQESARSLRDTEDDENRRTGMVRQPPFSGQAP